MLCPGCHTPNRTTRRFCAECGASLTPTDCGSCGYGNLPGEKFCGGCGIGVVVVAPVREEAERRQLTVMFCDLVGSTALSRQLDAEDYRDVIRSYQDTCVAEIERFGGVISRYMGDGMLVHFGYPRAREDDPERAVRAGLGILTEVAEQPGIEVRIGVATGTVVVGDIIGEGASEEAAVVGETPNLAARLQSLATPGSMLVSERTRRLISDAIQFEDMGSHPLKGFADPVPAWRAVAIAAARVAAVRAPMVGRVGELKMLTDLWKSAHSGQGQAVAVHGPPGIGKSRLVDALRAAVAPDARVFSFPCRPHNVGTALHPVSERIAQLAGFSPDDGRDDRQEKLGTWLGTWSAAPTEVDAVRALMGVGEAVPRSDMLRGLHRWLDPEVATLLIFEDVQWADATTRHWLEDLMAGARSRPLLVVATHRPDVAIPAGVSVAVARLDRFESAALVREAGGGELQEGVVARIVDRADGVPAFLEELARTVRGNLANAADVAGVVIPDTLQDSLMAQLDRLGEAREVAQTGAVIGRSFSKWLLASVYSGRAPLETGLSRLIESGLVIDNDGEFAFRHALVRDLAYASLLRKSRRQLHLRIADVLVERAKTVAVQAELVARHLAQADRQDEALVWWKQAADRAVAAGATREAVAMLRCAVDSLPDLGEEDDAEPTIDLHIQLGLQLRLDEDREAALEALSVAEEMATARQLHSKTAHVYYARGNVLFQEGDSEGCRRAHEQSLAFARQAGDFQAEVRALGGIGDANIASGDYRASLAAYTECVTLADERGYTRIAAVNAGMVASAAHWLLELPIAHDYALDAMARTAGAGLARPRLNCAVVAASVFNDLGDEPRVAEYMAIAMPLADQLGPISLSVAIGHYAAWKAMRGESSETRVRQAYALCQRDPRSGLMAGGAMLRWATGHELDVLVDQILAGCAEPKLANSVVYGARGALPALVSRGDLALAERLVPVIREATSHVQAGYLDLLFETAEAVMARIRDSHADSLTRLKKVHASALNRGVGSVSRLTGEWLSRGQPDQD